MCDENTTENKWSKFKSIIIVDRKQKDVIVDICGDIINNNPTDEGLKGLKRYVRLRTIDILKLPESDKKKYLLEFLKHFYRKEGRTPERRDFNNNPKYPSFGTYQNVFGSWNNAIKEAGFTPRWSRGHLYTSDELLRCLIRFYEENGRPPTYEDLQNNPKYPSSTAYIKRFVTLQKALELVGLDIDSMVTRGIIETEDQKRRLVEILVRNHFPAKDRDKVIDLSKENCNSPYDGICPNGQKYDAKGSKQHRDKSNTEYWKFGLYNLEKDKIEWYYLLAFNEDWTELLHTWRIPAHEFLESIKKGYIRIYKGQPLRIYSWSSSKTYENMMKYEIIDKVMPTFESWLNNIKKTNGDIIIDAYNQLKLYDKKAV